MAITHGDIGSDENVARRVLARVRVIAPCILSLSADSEDGKTAIAILKAVVADGPALGARRQLSMSRNGTSVSMDNASAWFSSDDEAALRALCDAPGATAGSPAGSFPIDDPTSLLWPEGRYS